MTSDSAALAARRAAVEDELRQRLERAAVLGTKTTPVPAAHVQCLGCQSSNAIDARFCTTCGARFNVRVMPAPGNRSSA